MYIIRTEESTAVSEPMPKPLPLTEDQIKALERRVKDRWQIHSGDTEALFMTARAFNEMRDGAKATVQHAS